MNIEELNKEVGRKFQEFLKDAKFVVSPTASQYGNLYRIKFTPNRRLNDENIPEIAEFLANQLVGYLNEFSTPDKNTFYMANYVSKKVEEVFKPSSNNGVRYEMTASVNNLLLEKTYTGAYIVSVMGNFDLFEPKAFTKEL